MYSAWLCTVDIIVGPLGCYTAQTSAGLVCNSANVPALAVDRQPSLSPALFSHLKSGMIEYLPQRVVERRQRVLSHRDLTSELACLKHLQVWGVIRCSTVDIWKGEVAN